MDDIVELLRENQDEPYADFQSRLIPTIARETILGVRTPALRSMAKKLYKDERCGEFLRELPHAYFEENQLHGFVVSEIREFDRCIGELERFLPYINNWATCDQTSPKVFRKHKKELLPYIRNWLDSDHVYTVRFGIGMLMQHYLDEDFQPDYLDWVTGIRSEEYYIHMEIAWYMATALAKQWEAAISCLEENRMEKWVHNRTIQKARESYRITQEQKEYLKALKR